MRRLRFSGLFDGRTWIEPAYVTLDDDGAVGRIEREAPAGWQADEDIAAYAIPGFQNGHSHAFQYAMAGLAEHLAPGRSSDDFWSWREAMYRLAQKITPEQLESVAAMVYAEMLRCGITAVAEFHYLHHDVGGKPYTQPAEMAARLMAAARTAGIHLTLVPIFYQLGGFAEPPRPTQVRFISRTIDDYGRLLEATRAVAVGRDDTLVGIGVHSLRAVKADDVKRAFKLDTQAVAHVHVAEQKREVVDCLKHLGARPVAWLLDQVGLDRRFALVHATHCTPEELDRLGQSGATVVVCPSTEGNLGDGLFGLERYRAAGGGVAIGTDSHIGLSPLEELRWLDYGQRLQLLKRNVVCAPGQDSGEVAVAETWRRGRMSMGLWSAAEAGPFAVGAPFDAAVIDASHPLLASKPAARRLAAVVYGGDASVLCGTIRRGRWLVERGRHIRAEAIRAAYAQAAAALAL
jgi:formimidoylglutamate deiminase